MVKGGKGNPPPPPRPVCFLWSAKTPPRFPPFPPAKNRRVAVERSPPPPPPRQTQPIAPAKDRRQIQDYGNFAARFGIASRKRKHAVLIIQRIDPAKTIAIEICAP